MYFSSRFVAIAAVLFLFAANAQAQSLSGQWRVTSGSLHGKNVPTSVLNSMSLNLTDSKFTATSQSLTSTGDFTANSGINPLQVVFNIDGGADLGRELKAIYKFQGRNLQIVYSDNDQFPTDFQSTAANRYLILTYAQGQPTGAGVANVPPIPPGGSGAGLGSPDQ